MDFGTRLWQLVMEMIVTKQGEPAPPLLAPGMAVSLTIGINKSLNKHSRVIKQ